MQGEIVRILDDEPLDKLYAVQELYNYTPPRFCAHKIDAIEYSDDFFGQIEDIFIYAPRRADIEFICGYDRP